jgi:L-lactate utilization protein LutB
MDQPVAHYWKIRLNAVKKALEANNFEVYLAENCHQARKIALDEIIPRTGAKSVAWGGSMTYLATELYTILKNDEHLTVIDTFDKSVSPEEGLQRRRQALLADLFITGTNAVTESGQLVNLDMIGNRVAALTFGPRHVILFVGRNKIVSDLEAARKRIKDFAAPANAMRLDKKTPCAQTGTCEACKSPDRICNTWTITEKSYPKARVKVVLINEDLGL